MTRLDKALAALATLSLGQLNERWMDMGSGSTPCVPAPLLRRLLAQRLQEKRFGGLTLLVVRELERVASASGSVPDHCCRGAR